MILRGGLLRGLQMADTERMTLGMWIGYIIVWNNMHRMESEPETKTRRATQADFDAF